MKRILIIGATSGIGLETTRCYIQKGWRVGIAGRRINALQELQNQFPDQVAYEAFDITSPDAAEHLNSLIQKTGGMDIFLLSSGIGSQNKELNPEIELNTVRTNVEGFTRMVTVAFDFFKRQGFGHIAVISSIAGTKGIGVAPSYSATKRFQNNYIQALAQLAHLKKLNIQFTDIRPGFVETDLLKDRAYPLLMKADQVAVKITQAIERKKRIVVIDYKYKILVFFWKLIPGWIWERLSIK
ncbi:SDR family NAD(P)-dependent oxidoreductase [Massilibacteroides sp.]|uniref:SDR family NAD(P)-dependent oxidoreductase n=1 Tax=Massilibacteroides sp. TaxID=2034766 RepID=UPI00260CBF98|nr:SDR family NAD(P)-dependent oxidoreductase [Massilibacteroides sp.]MDD4514484.1 SDR family NAD(P)-dependent oxidoreductase [Massilibacteroides sp.]